MRLSVVIRPDKEAGGYVAEVPEIPGCLSEGDTIEEAIANIREAAEGCLASMVEHRDAMPRGVSYA